MEIKKERKCSGFSSITVGQLKEILNQIKTDLESRLENGKLTFKNVVLSQEKTLEFYDFKNEDEIKIEKALDASKSVENAKHVVEKSNQFLKVAGLRIYLEPDPLVFRTTTIGQFKVLLVKDNNLRNQLENGKLMFEDHILEDVFTLEYYGIKNEDEISIRKFYNQSKLPEIQFTVGRCAITGDDDGELKAVMSCGHAVDPNSLTYYCKNKLIYGVSVFKCPAIRENTECKKEWEYTEVRKLALLTECEKEFFETQLERLTALRIVEFKSCPNCHISGIRLDSSSLKIRCQYCQKLKNQDFSFCWQCNREWDETINKPSGTCGREDCIDENMFLLQNTNYIKLTSVDMECIPSTRACPTCGVINDRNEKLCKNIVCITCGVSFCFACLETTNVCSKTSSVFGKCSKPVAPIQKIYTKLSLEDNYDLYFR